MNCVEAVSPRKCWLIICVTITTMSFNPLFGMRHCLSASRVSIGSEHFIMGAAYLVNCILQGVFCMVVVHLGSAVALEDAATTDWEVWREQAQPGEVRGVCGPSLDYSLTSSYLQVSFVHVARDYLTKAILGFSLGPVLTVTVIALWSGTTVKSHQESCGFHGGTLELVGPGVVRGEHAIQCGEQHYQQDFTYKVCLDDFCCSAAGERDCHPLGVRLLVDGAEHVCLRAPPELGLLGLHHRHG